MSPPRRAASRPRARSTPPDAPDIPAQDRAPRRTGSTPAAAAGTAAAPNPYKGATGLRRIVLAFGHSIAGIRAAWAGESAFRQEAVLAAVLLPLAPWLAPTRTDAALMIGSVLLVLIVELLNSALEAVVDRISFERHELSGRAKDMGSAAVLLSLVLLGLTWVSALRP